MKGLSNVVVVIANQRGIRSLGINPCTHVLSFCLTLFLASSLGAAPLRLGDLDEDRTPTVLDLTRLIRHWQGDDPLPTPLQPYGDLNEDGIINQADLDLLADCILGISPLPNPFSPPEVTVPTTATNGNSVIIGGISRPNRIIRVAGGAGIVQGVAGSDGVFSVNIPLQTNRLNLLFLTASNDTFASGIPLPLRILQDSQPPQCIIDFPTNGTRLTDSSVDVAGRIGDMLSGFMGLTVTALVGTNSATTNFAGLAAVNVGIGNNGTFDRLVPLVLGTNSITVIASDSLGNRNTNRVTVTRIPLVGPRILALSGDRQGNYVHSRLPQPIVVRLTQGDGMAPLANQVVEFQVTRSDGRLLPANTNQLAADYTRQPDASANGAMLLKLRTDAQGEARVWWTLGSDAGCGNNRVCVTSASVSNNAYFCASASALPASQINIGSGNNQKGETGAPAAEPLRVWVNDSCNGSPYVPVTFTVIRGGAKLYPLNHGVPYGEGGSPITVLSSQTGHAEVGLEFGPQAGQNIVEATWPGNPGLPATFIAYGVARDPSKPTSFSGIVLDNTSQPLGNAECSLTVGNTTLTTVSDAQGQFRFDDTPAGSAELYIDGANVMSVGGYYVPPNSFPPLRYLTILIPNAENSLPTPVLLPRLNAQNGITYRGTNDLVLTCAGIEGLKMTIKANSMRKLDGSLVTPANPAVVSLNQVHHDDVPMPMPDGASPPFAWTLQPARATFDPPIQIEYPNMSGLPPGSVAYFLSFNHDTERFEIVASGHVLNDGSSIVTDPGVGLTIAGWGCNCPPYSVTGECEKACSDDPRVRERIGALKKTQQTELAAANRSLNDALEKAGSLIGKNGAPPLVTFSQNLTALRVSYQIAEASVALLSQTWALARISCLIAIPEPTPFGEIACAAFLVAFSTEMATAIGSVGATAFFAYKIYEDLAKVAKAAEAVDDLEAALGHAVNAADLALQIEVICAALAVGDAARTAAEELRARIEVAKAKLEEIKRQVDQILAEVGAIIEKLGRIKKTLEEWKREVDRFLGREVGAARAQLLANESTNVWITLPSGFSFEIQLVGGIEPDTNYFDQFQPDYSVITTNQQALLEISTGFEILSTNAIAVSNAQALALGRAQALLNAYSGLESTLDFSDWILSVNGQVVVPSSDGSFKIRNIAAPDQFGLGGPGSAPDFLSDTFVRLTGFRTANGVTRYVFSEPFQIRAGETYSIGELTFTDIPPPLPESLRAVPDVPTLTGIGQSTQVRVTARMADGSTSDVTPRTSWTLYRTSNPNIATVGPDGLVTAVNRGIVFITAVNEGATAVTQIIVSPDDQLTTVSGLVQTTNGVPAVGATVNIISLNFSAVTDATGRFSIAGVPTGFGSITLSVVVIEGGNRLVARALNLETVSGGVTDAGVLVLEPLEPALNNALAAGGAHNFTLDTEGTLWSWGGNNSGQLGDGSTVNRSYPPRVVGFSNEWALAAAGATHSIGIKIDGSLWAWGNNASGQLGDGTRTNQSSPLRIGLGNDWAQVTAGGNHTLALTASGALWGWGRGFNGQLGTGGTSDSTVPIQVGTAQDWQAVAAGANHTVALKLDGSLWAWGFNLYGQVGTNGTNTALAPVRVQTPLSGWSAIAAGDNHSVGLRLDGSLWAWGRNNSGQIGDGTVLNRLTPVQVQPGSNDWVAVSAGASHTIALKVDGTLWAWGANNQGQLGNNSTASESSPVRIGTRSDWVVIKAGANHNLALTLDGSLWVWGANSFGQLSDGATASRLIPTKVSRGFVPDGLENPDFDSLNNLREYFYETNPDNADTDGDGWDDGTEVLDGTNPLDRRSGARLMASSTVSTYLNVADVFAPGDVPTVALSALASYLNAVPKAPPATLAIGAFSPAVSYLNAWAAPLPANLANTIAAATVSYSNAVNQVGGFLFVPSGAGGGQ